MKQHKRAFRKKIQARVVVSFSGNVGFTGSSFDVSETGIKIVTGYAPPGVNVGDSCELTLLHCKKEHKQPLPGKVVRITEKEVVINFSSSKSSPLWLLSR
ncbi:MAG: PilZ domain-containing protein [Magnetococcales bacterium]|nr:PilZ domain-containing protein [Magnetococcales bacterium]